MLSLRRAALTEADCTFADVLRVRYLLTDRADFEPCQPVLRRRFAAARPAGTMLVCGLADPRMKIEIEVDARRTRQGEEEDGVSYVLASP
jgi:Putative translation initiation inhibitor, yjgF family